MRVAFWFRLAGTLAAAIALLAVGMPSAQARGKLVRGTSPAVYYVGTDGQRYVFPNERIFYSWYPDFSDVDTVDDADLAEYPLGGNVTYRPGTRLVKLTNDPKVYAVEPGGVLRWVTSETIAETLYGEEWAARVDDLPDGFFPAYSIGEDLETALYPEGTLLSEDGDYFVVWGGARHALSSTAFSSNGYDGAFAVPRSPSVELTTGDDISGGKTYLYDTAQLGLGEELEHAVSVEAADFDTTVVKGANGTVIAAFVVSLREETTVSKPQMILEARTNADEDADAGGLVRGDGDDQQIEANLQYLRVTDAAGTSLFGTKQLSVADDADGEQAVSFSGSATLRPGRHLLYVTANIPDDVPTNERYQATFDVDGTTWTVGNAQTDDADPASVEADAFTVKEGLVSVTRDSSVASSVVLRGTDGQADAAAFAFESSYDDDSTLTRLVLTAYVDANEGSADFQVGTDGDTSGTLSLDDVVDSVSVVRASDGETLGTTYDVGPDGLVAFDGVRWSIPGAAEEILVVRVTVDADAPTGLDSDRIAFDIASPDDVDLENPDGDAASVDVSKPNGGTSPKTILTLASSGTLTIDGSGNPDDVVVMSATDAAFYALTLTAGDEEDMEVGRLSFRYVSQDAGRNVKDATLRVGSDEYDGDVSVSGITFDGLSLLVSAGEEVEAQVLLDINGSSEGAVSGGLVGIGFEPSTLQADGVRSGTRLDADDVGGKVTDTTEDGTEATVRRNLPTVSIAADEIDTDQREDADMDLLRFMMGSEGEGTSKLKTISFKIEPNDVGESGSDNDLLEILADVNGDDRDDNDVATLYDDTSNDVVAEGGDGHVSYLIYDKSGGGRDATPAGTDTATGDYGLVVFEFTTSLTLWSVPHEYAFRLRVLDMAGDNPSVKATLLGGSDFEWNDGTSSTADQDGASVDGLPVAGPTVYID